ncbi:MAG: TIGR03619 family F420-dependent LLM class oxidoreductase [Gammaproteobacteria bacterium]|jgi:probable F420-dependent oxidoreductase|nr:TIGR03619 family F420-dependent LLM class oxidoreductase [Gammaproteobacteria bacterium]MBT7369828.1 TIGR03619 family F420-dependent LLM class oxidoreductase [Gammaproteobacteria bacterium]
MKFTICSAFVTPQEIAEIAVAAEGCGFDVVAFVDHVSHPETISAPYTFSEDGIRPWNETAVWPEPWTMMSHVAALTTRVEFMTAVYVLPLRNPALVAQQVSTVSQLANRRIYLGVGSGWSSDEFNMAQQSFEGRGKRIEEMIDVMRSLWQGEMVEHHGRHFDFDRLIMLPKPSEPIPILFGGDADIILRRAARMGDGWISPPATIADSLGTVARLRQLLEEEGRTDDSFEFVLTVTDGDNLDEVKRAIDAGVDNIILTNPWLFEVFVSGGAVDDSAVEGKIDGVRRYAEKIIEPAKQFQKTR